jgi:cysteine-rich repeat protein
LNARYSLLALSFFTFVGCTDKQAEPEDNLQLVDEMDPQSFETGISELNKSRGGINGDFDYCARSSCGVAEGDCDSNAECEPGLVCTNNVGPRFGQPLDWDYCLGPQCNNGIQDIGETGVDTGGLCGGSTCSATRGEAGSCTTSCPCSDGEGDCDRQSECEPGLICVANNGPSYGLPANFDACAPVQCANRRKDVNEVGIDCGGPCGSCYPRCGNMVVDQGEQCDDGNRRAADGCEPNCMLPASVPVNAVCGNGTREGFEECDDGNVAASDGCSPVCNYETVCGNGVVEAGEQCDDANQASGDGCVGCLAEGPPGNGVVNAGEQCDDGNIQSGDGCSQAMLCEDGTVLTFEGLGDNAPVGNFYNGGAGTNYSIEFGPTALALIDSDVGGGGNFGGEPSESTILFFLSGASTVMNVPGGFDGGFSVYYSAISSPGQIRVYDGVDGTGNLLQTVYLPITPSNGGDPTGSFSPFYPVGVTFPGTARSVDFGGVANQIGMDDIRVGACQ